jgi:hypothetical protein
MTFTDVLSWQQPRQTERSFQASVVRYATLMGWRCYHTHRSDHSAAGFPDLVLVRRPRIVFAELKGPRTPTSSAQIEWLDELRACGQEVYRWRAGTADWEIIERVLGR